jgi:hypothetical protein
MALDEERPPIRVAVVLAADPHDVGGWLADGAAFEAAGADELWIGDEGALDPFPLAAALAIGTHRARLGVRSSGEAAPRTLAVLDRIGRGRFAMVDDAEAARWHAVEAPDGRAAWRATLADAADRGVQGVAVPAGPQLLDILRNPDEPGERHDLQLTVG